MSLKKRTVETNDTRKKTLTYATNIHLTTTIDKQQNETHTQKTNKINKENCITSISVLLIY